MGILLRRSASAAASASRRALPALASSGSSLLPPLPCASQGSLPLFVSSGAEKVEFCGFPRGIHYLAGPLRFSATDVARAEYAVDDYYEEKKGSPNGVEEGLEVAKLGISQDMVSQLAKRGITKLFPMQENKLHIHRELVSSDNGIFKTLITGNKSIMRCMTTMGHPKVSSVQESSVATPETSQPQRIKFKRLDKTAKHIMNILDKEAVDKVRDEREIPDIRPGYIIQLKVEVPENKRRTSTIKGIVIARRNAGLNTTFRLRRLVAGVGIESVFPLYSPNIKEIKVLDKKKVRRAKLYYLRDRMNPLKK